MHSPHRPCGDPSERFLSTERGAIGPPESTPTACSGGAPRVVDPNNAMATNLSRRRSTPGADRYQPTTTGRDPCVPGDTVVIGVPEFGPLTSIDGLAHLEISPTCPRPVGGLST